MASIARTRLTEERKAWRKDHPVGFFARLDANPDGSTNLMRWRCGIPGKEGTAWAGGLFELVVDFDEDYPHKPPACKFAAPDFPHVNVYTTGKICLSILNEDSGWTPAISLRQILVGVQELLHTPNPRSAANAQVEAYRLMLRSEAEYVQRVRQFARQHPPELLLK